MLKTQSSKWSILFSFQQLRQHIFLPVSDKNICLHTKYEYFEISNNTKYNKNKLIRSQMLFLYSRQKNFKQISPKLERVLNKIRINRYLLQNIVIKIFQIGRHCDKFSEAAVQRCSQEKGSVPKICSKFQENTYAEV